MIAYTNFLQYFMTFSLIVFATSTTFPGYNRPGTADSPIYRPMAKSCVVKFSSIAVRDYSAVYARQYKPPTSCFGDRKRVGKVVLDVYGKAHGRQFDRYGAIWLNGVEILRTTTPEPSRYGISWHIEKDLTDYLKIFDKKSLLSVSIPNVVNKIYTGILHLEVSFTFFLETDSFKGPKVSPSIIRIKDPTNGGTHFPWSKMSSKGKTVKTFKFTMPTRNTEHLYLDLYASAHGHEEFWNLDAPHGSSYRQFVVTVDNQGAGISYPFPVVYTGGINPLLWKPLTGIMSFDIPAYRYNLSPFVGLLNDGKEHKLSVRVVGNSPRGFWFVDPVLLAYTNNKYKVLPGSIISHTFNPKPDLDIKYIDRKLMTDGKHTFRTVGAIVKDGKRFIRSVSVKLSNKNVIDQRKATSAGVMKTLIEETYGTDEDKEEIVHITHLSFPYHVRSFARRSSLFVSQTSNVEMGREGSETWKYRTSGKKFHTYTLSWNNKMESDAFYNISRMGWRYHHERSSDAKESYVVNEKLDNKPAKRCYHSAYKARGGFIMSAKRGLNACVLPGELSLCGSKLFCGTGSMMLEGEISSKKLFDPMLKELSLKMLQTSNKTKNLIGVSSRAKQRNGVLQPATEESHSIIERGTFGTKVLDLSPVEEKDDKVWMTMRHPKLGREDNEILARDEAMVEIREEEAMMLKHISEDVETDDVYDEKEVHNDHEDLPWMTVRRPILGSESEL